MAVGPFLSASTSVLPDGAAAPRPGLPRSPGSLPKVASPTAPIRYNPSSMRVAIGADHAGFDLKQQLLEVLRSDGHESLDVGAHALDPGDDYPDFALAVAERVRAGDAQRGIVVCGSGVGSCVAANKVAGVRASVCHDTYSASQGVEHDSLNVLCLGGRIVGIALATELVRAFLGATYRGTGRFARRLNKVLAVERGG